MKNEIAKWVLLLIVIFHGNETFSQENEFKDRNQKYLDSVELVVIKYICRDSISYPKSYKEKLVNRDLAIISILNTIYSKNVKAAKIDSMLSKLKKVVFGKEEKLKGLIKVTEIVMNGEYLHAEVRLESVNDFIFRKKTYLNPNTIGRCGQYGDRVFDFKLIKTYVIQNIRFPIRLSDRTWMVRNEFLESELKLESIKESNYKFNLDFSNDSTDWVRQILVNQYNDDSSRCYYHREADINFVSLIKNNKTEVIKRLLYSPNYLYSINAMESIIYLASKNKIAIDDSIANKINEIKNANYDIYVQRSFDSYMHIDGYKILNLSDQRVIEKYQKTLDKQ